MFRDELSVASSKIKEADRDWLILEDETDRLS